MSITPLAWEQAGPVLGPLTEYTAQDRANEQRWRALYDVSPLEEDPAWLMGIDLPLNVPRLELPAIFMGGRFDYKAPLGLVEEYVAGLEAPSGKQMIAFEQSAHVVFLEERTLFRDVMIHTVMPYRN